MPEAPTRSDRRRTETRRRLLEAAGELFSEKGVGNTRIGEITERADVAAGSFYNHFDDKDALVESLLAGIAEAQGRDVDEATAQIQDPAEVVAFAHRHFIRLAGEDPSFGQLILRLNASHGLLREILGPRAVRDIRSGIETGRFSVADPVAASFSTGGALLGTISGIVEGVLDSSAADMHVEAVLRMLGVPGDEATGL